MLLKNIFGSNYKNVNLTLKKLRAITKSRNVNSYKSMSKDQFISSSTAPKTSNRWNYS